MPADNVLDRLARKYGTDKGTGSRRAGSRSPKGYTRHYSRYLSDRRETSLRLLEIGVDRGASLRMWEDYFPNGTIFGIDKRVTCLKRQTARTRVFVGDQADPAFLDSVVQQIGEPLDVIIDDGGHQVHQQAASLSRLFSHLSPGGFYAIEDLHTAYRSAYGGGYLKPDSTVELLKRLVDQLNGWGTEPAFIEGVSSVHFYQSIAFIFRR